MKSIGNYAFSKCSKLTSITVPFVGRSGGLWDSWFGYIFGADHSSNNGAYVPSSLKTVVVTDATNIDNEAFRDCSSLTSITIPSSVKSIGDDAFIGCSGLTSITIPDRVASIGNYAFRNCSNLTSITIPSSVTSIGKWAFWDCSSLTSITFKGTRAQWNVMDKEFGWDEDIGKYTIHCTDGEITK
ncbi:MAG: leucine-rich repeat domain-containing protein [Clostridiales bacterium]|nr:leucine-rich repeat domain-containing protein [Clostridiales bacterium]